MSGAILILPLYAAMVRTGTNICFCIFVFLLKKIAGGPHAGRLGCELNLCIYHSLLLPDHPSSSSAKTGIGVL
jgi:hypothetical protein